MLSKKTFQQGLVVGIRDCRIVLYFGVEQGSAIERVATFYGTFPTQCNTANMDIFFSIFFVHVNKSDSFSIYSPFFFRLEFRNY